MATRVSATRLVGRTQELAELSSVLPQAAAGHPSLAFVAGESGVGKSRLTAELSRRAAADGHRVLRGDCVALGDGELPYAPLVGALRPLARAEDPVLLGLPAGVRRELATLLPSLGDRADLVAAGRAQADQGRLFEALLSLVDALAAERPTLLVVEDLHWADASTRAFLRFLAAALATERLLVVLTYRPDELHRRHPLRPLLAELERGPCARRVDLAPLTRDELAEQLADILGAAPDDALLEDLWRRCEGNPLFSEELLAAGAPPVANPDGTMGVGGAGAVPPGVREALGLRIERLGPDAQEVVRVLSAGTSIAHDVLAEVAGLEPRALREALREAISEHIVVAGDDLGYGFRHALLREVAHDDLLPGERAELHGALAAALGTRLPEGVGREGVQAAAAVAHHAFAAGDQPFALAAAVHAGQAAQRAQAYGEAADLYERALALWPRVPDAAVRTGLAEEDVAERAGFCRLYHDQLGRAEDLGHRALALIDAPARPRRAATIHELLARAQWGLLRQEASMATVGAGLTLLADDGPSPERVGLLVQEARALMLQGRYERSVRTARTALAEQREELDPCHLDESRALNAMGVSLIALGEEEEGLRALRRALALARVDGRLADIGSAANNLADSLHLLGRTAEGLELATAAHAEVEGLGRTRSWLGLAIAELAFDAGDWATAERLLAEDGWGARWLGQSGLNTRLRHAELALGTGALDVAAEHLAHARALAVDCREPQFLGVLHTLEVELGRRRGDLAAARATVDEGLDRIEFCSDDVARIVRLATAGVRVEADAAQQARDLGDPGAEAEALRRAGEGLARVRAVADDGVHRPVEEAWLHTARGEHARAVGQDDPRLWESAAAAWDALGRPYLAAQCRWRRAEALVATGSREEAGAPAARAREQARALPSPWLVAEVEGLAARARLRLRPADAPCAPAEPETDPFGLTRRERQVLALVASGHTNREIGRQLYMAEKTASVHVSRILAKLDVRSRTEAAGMAHRLGLDAGR